MRHDGMQEECSDEENEQSLIKFMTENSEVIPESAPAQKKKESSTGRTVVYWRFAAGE